MQPVALTIAGSDPSGGAGIQADLKTFHQFHVYGQAVITLVTVQNSVGLSRVECLAPDLVLEQITAVLQDIQPLAAKTGALGNRALIQAVAGAAAEFRFPLVVDPVMLSKQGSRLLEESAVQALRAELLPRAYLLTPNLAEASALSEMPVNDLEGMRRAGRELCRMGAAAVLVKGGHLAGAATDVLVTNANVREFVAPRIQTRHTHGTGCTYSAAITAELARGADLESAIVRAKDFVTEAIRSNPGLGKGAGPLNHHAGERKSELHEI